MNHEKLFLVPDKPTNVKFTRVTYEYVEVEWDTPSRPNGRIMTYRVHYRRNITGGEWMVAEISKYNLRSARAKALVFNSYYLFKIEGRTAVGWGEPALEYVLVTTNRGRLCSYKYNRVCHLIEFCGLAQVGAFKFSNFQSSFQFSGRQLEKYYI